MAAESHLWNGAAGDNDFDAVGNWHSADTPASTDTVIFPALAAASTKDVAGEDKSAVLLANFFVEPGFACDLGSRIAPLYIDTDALTYAGSGQAFLQVDNCAGAMRILDVGAGGDGSDYGLLLLGATNALLICDSEGSGDIALGGMPNDDALTGFACTTIIVKQGNVTLGSDVTMTNLIVSGGTVTNYSGATTITQTGGTLHQEAARVATLNLNGGTYYHNSDNMLITFDGGTNMTNAAVGDTFTDGTWTGVVRTVPSGDASGTFEADTFSGGFPADDDAITLGGVETADVNGTPVTLGTVNIRDEGVLDLTGTAKARSIGSTAVNLYGGTIKFPRVGIITWTNPVTLDPQLAGELSFSA